MKQSSAPTPDESPRDISTEASPDILTSLPLDAHPMPAAPAEQPEHSDPAPPAEQPAAPEPAPAPAPKDAQSAKAHKSQDKAPKEKSTKNNGNISPLCVLLMDTDNAWGVPQEQALTLALALAAQGRHAPVLCCPKDSPLSILASEHGLTSLALAPHSAKNLMTLLRLWLFQRKHRAILVHSFSPEAATLGWRMARWRRPGATALLHSCFDERDTPPLQEGEITDRAWLSADKIICAQTVLRAYLASSGIDAGRLPVVHPGIDADALPVRTPRQDGRFVFVATEDLDEGAGLFVLLRAMAALWQRDDLPPWEVRINGDGPAFAQILQEAQSLGVAARLALLSYQVPGEVLPLCDALVAPHRQPQGHLAALFSAWCSDLPLVCSAVPAHMELARAGQTALTVPAGDSQALAAAMIRLMTDPALCQSLVQHSQYLRQYAAYERMIDQNLALYTDCVARQGWVLPQKATTPSPLPHENMDTQDTHEV